MPLFVEVFVVVVVMLGAFFGVFLLIFLFAMAMLPVEKSLSKAIWDMTRRRRGKRLPRRAASKLSARNSSKNLADRKLSRLQVAGQALQFIQLGIQFADSGDDLTQDRFIHTTLLFNSLEPGITFWQRCQSAIS